MRVGYQFEGRIEPLEQPAGSYFYLPFSVPEGARRLAVSYHYEGGTTVAAPPTESTWGKPQNVIDIAVFDERGVDPITGGFRGYSGSARASFCVEPAKATPGYMAGKLGPGEWNLMLGVAVLLPDGARWWATVELDVDESAAQLEQEPIPEVPRRPTPRRNAGRQGRWIPGDLHSHTEHSDGLNTVAELASHSQSLGLKYLAITDHNTISHHREVDALSSAELLLLAGEEVTTYYGHANVWGLREWADFRLQDDPELRHVVDWVHQHGKLFSINHPKREGPDWRFHETAFDCVEVWQAPWRWRNEESLALWSTLLREGRRIVAVGGSDIHSVPPAAPVSPHGPGNPTTWVWVEGAASEQAVLDAVRAGHVFISESPQGPTIDMRAGGVMVGDSVAVAAGPLQAQLQLRGVEGRTLVLRLNEDEVWRRCYDVESADEEVPLVVEQDAPLRAELWGPRGRPERGDVVWALTNPIYLTVR